MRIKASESHLFFIITFHLNSSRASHELKKEGEQKVALISTPAELEHEDWGEGKSCKPLDN